MDRAALLYNAKLAEQIERYDEMVSYMESIALLNIPLTAEERTLLSVGYKNFMGTKRLAWRTISCALDSTVNLANSERDMIGKFKSVVEKEMIKVSRGVIKLIDENLLTNAIDSESRAFYLKLYLAEIDGDGKAIAVEHSQRAYEDASKIASQFLPAIHPVRLGIALNYSVFFNEILGKPTRAYNLAKFSFDEAISDIGNITEEHYKDTTLIMQLIRDNLTLWTSESVPGTHRETTKN